ncbi:hypothetical protein [Komagataeibacter diospyri]|uniref:hypothetical protein n=1 Tax=Komagataeibacter diospyri TaxID=1932662 RepID=UPI0011418B1E|nr:hypothetical protein [Komagataeibacter diospyri]
MSVKIEIKKNGEVVGWYTAKNGLITVTSAKNGRSCTARGSADGEGLARLMLTEKWAQEL